MTVTAARPRRWARIPAAYQWGLYWLRCAADYPEHADACHWNSFMEAMNIMALEASPHAHGQA